MRKRCRVEVRLFVSETMEPKLQLCVFTLLIQVSLAVLRQVAIEKGHTLILTCPMKNAHKTLADWKNPEGYLMFFNGKKVLNDKRYSIDKLSRTEFTISVSNITFKDGGVYTCSEYDHSTTERKWDVTVLGRPRMTVTKHGQSSVVKCTAEGSSPYPKITWQLDEKPEIEIPNQHHSERKRYTTVSQITVHTPLWKVAVKCLVRHPALNLQPLMDFVKIGRDRPKGHLPTTTTSLPTARPEEPTHGGKTVSYSIPDLTGPSTGYPTGKTMSTPTSNYISTTGSQVSTNKISELSSPTTVMTETTNNETSTNGWTPYSDTTQEIASGNITEKNITAVNNNPRIQTKGNSSLLVLLVTFLIICLLVVVIFFAIKLRRAHLIWKRENEESDPSEESNKSKSSSEEKSAQRRKGLFNTAFTQYVVEEPTTVTSVVNTGVMAATAIVNNGHASQVQPMPKTAARVEIKETEL